MAFFGLGARSVRVIGSKPARDQAGLGAYAKPVEMVRAIRERNRL